MAAVDPADALQEGIYTLLDDDPTLNGLVLGVYDGVPEDVELQPGDGYVDIGEMAAVIDGTHSGEGKQTSATLHTWTRAESHKLGNDMGARIGALLWHRHVELDAAVAGHKVWRVEHEYAQTMVDPEPGIRHRVDRFRIWTSQEA
jgi:hypothetical protein